MKTGKPASGLAEPGAEACAAARQRRLRRCGWLDVRFSREAIVQIERRVDHKDDINEFTSDWRSEVISTKKIKAAN